MIVSKKYTKEFLIDEFWRFYKENNRYPNSKEMIVKNGYPSIDAYKTHWGTWSEFIITLGFMGSNGWYKYDEEILINMYYRGEQEDIINSLMIPRKWGAIKQKARQLGLNRDMYFANYNKKKFDDEFLISELKRYYNTYNKIPTHNDFKNKLGYPSTKAYINHFGSWNNALRKAGMDVNLQFNNYTKEDMIKIGLDYYNNTGNIPLSHEIGFTYSVIKKYWGNWNNYLSEINLKSNKVNKYSREELLNKLIVFYNLLGRKPNKQDFIDYSWHPSYDSYNREFGGLINACVVAGLIEEPLTLKERINISIKQLQTLADQLDKCPTVEDYELYNNKGLCRRELERKLDLKYNDICKRYIPQYPVNVDSDISQEEITQTITNIYNKLGRPPMYIELRDYNCNYSFTIFNSKFNMTYNQLIRHMGWTPTGTDTLKRSEEDMLDDFYNLFKELKRIPTFFDIDNNKNIASGSTYIKYFGSFENVCKLLDINYDQFIKNAGVSKYCFDNLGGLCRSYAERDIANYFISNNIRFDKEPRYNEIIKNQSYRKRFDWKIYIDDKTYFFVEYFGMFTSQKNNKIVKRYIKKTRKKIKLLYKNNCINKCIFIFPWDLKNKTLDQIFEPYFNNINLIA